MSDELMRLLEKIEAAPPGKPHTVGDLIKNVDNNVVVER